MKSLILIFLFLQLFLSVQVEGICPDSSIDHAFSFVSLNEPCDGVLPYGTVTTGPMTPQSACTSCCKNFLSCDPTSLTCVEPLYVIIIIIIIIIYSYFLFLCF